MEELNKDDIEFIASKNLDAADMENYFNQLQEGFPPIIIHKNAEIGREIKSFDDGQMEVLRRKYREAKDLKVEKFVPASGAASRMFKSLFQAMESGDFNKIDHFFEAIETYAFGDELLKRAGFSKMEKPKTDEEKRKVLKVLLLPDGMDYGAQPKGMIAFHRYSDEEKRTAFEEHYHEAAQYAAPSGVANIHFTIPAEKKAEVESHLSALTDCLSRALGVHFSIETSVQKPSTDTPAINVNSKKWVRTDDGQILFRPAGHGALIENLDEINSDIIFVKNIDNVVPDTKKETTVEYKELLAGVLLDVRDEMFELRRELDKSDDLLAEAKAFIKTWFNEEVDGLNAEGIKALMDRPIKVCGMVKNQGEPGGGPFVVKEENGRTSLQIVEKAQLDLSDPEQERLLKTATHFNPVDLVLGVLNYKGEAFDLLRFRNEKTGMRVEKTASGQEIYALELPGLWNGAMYYWNTIFVEVPIETFNPVKTVFDLSREAHQV
ncbi:MAG TPA: DUF4301 family protein [Cryomorphaceae bacterium]|nr:DUF4301 family protein [Cryomorphaceae bacterium]